MAVKSKRGAGLAGRLSSVGKFGIVGMVAFAVDIGLFNILRFGGPLGILEHRPLMAKVISTVIATTVSWLGNRYWTFRHRRRAETGREFLLFMLMCSLGLAVSLACLYFSHYVLGLTSPLADNVAANIVGVGLGTIVRYVTYNKFVFTGSPRSTAEPRLDVAPVGSPAGARRD